MTDAFGLSAPALEAVDATERCGRTALELGHSPLELRADRLQDLELSCLD
ncbi:hypothetical protein [Natrinema soli]|uniref:Uncharacterized protein n=1 Tax=Natrinema soli TaxID=1930624 RepID=A0ABD5T211_9EURY|nr:hypothetical protein [Natrinema soli]